MKKALFISLVVTLIMGLAASGLLYAHGFGYYDEDDVRTEVKKIDNGIQITITSDDPEIAKDLQVHTKWYERIFEHGEKCPMMGYRDRYFSQHGCM